MLFYSSKYGIYEPNCGLDKVYMSWGHDEYLYRYENLIKFRNTRVGFLFNVLKFLKESWSHISKRRLTHTLTFHLFSGVVASRFQNSKILKQFIFYYYENHPNTYRKVSTKESWNHNSRRGFIYEFFPLIS